MVGGGGAAPLDGPAGEPSLDGAGFVFMSGFESTYMPHADLDVLETTRHVEYVEEDLSLARGLGLRHLRYSAPWHRIEPERGRMEWRWMDRAMNALRDLGIEPVVDLVHHTSFPRWMEQGFADPDFPGHLARFAGAFAERYPWARWYTVFNEPYITTIFCGADGIWWPNLKEGERTWVPMLLNVCRAIVEAQHAVVARVPHARFMHIDTCEHHHVLHASMEDHVRMLNERRFVAHDLVRARLKPGHPMWNWLRANGLDDGLAQCFVDKPARVDLLGLDYYAHSELGHDKTRLRVPTPRPLGFAAVAREYQTRYRSPALLSETNVRGTVRDRLTWLRHMLHQCELCELDGRPLRGFCWYPLIDSCDWDSLLRNPRNHVDPQGLFWLSKGRRKRHPSELTEAYGNLAKGNKSWRDLPYHKFSPNCRAWVRNHIPLMTGEGWED